MAESSTMLKKSSMAESSTIGQQAVVAVFTCAFCRRSFTAYNELGCHITSSHPHVNPLPPAAATIIGQVVESSTASADEIHPKSSSNNKMNKRKYRDELDMGGGASAVSSQHHCDICQTSLTSARALRLHKRSHRPPIPGIPAPPIEQQGAAGGMDYSESRSQVTQPRRSSRLLAKSAMTMSQTTDMVPSSKRRKPHNPKPKCLPFQAYQRGEFFVRGGYSEIPKFHQRQRKSKGRIIKYAYAYMDVCSDGWDKIIEKRFIVVSGGEKIHQQHVFPYVEGSHGITWIGVHGINSICAVYNKKPGRQCIIDWLKDSRLSAYFTDFVLSEMEDVADSPPYLEKILKKPVTVDSSPYPEKTLKPFAVVSLPDTSNADEKSCQEASAPTLEAQEQAIAHLQSKMIGLSAYSMRQTQLIAISAFQLLWERELKAEEITVCCFYEEGHDDYEIRNLSRAKVNKRLEAIKDLKKGIVC